MGKGTAGPELTDCEAQGDRELRNVVLQRKDLTTEHNKKEEVLAQHEEKKSRYRKMEGLKKFRGVGTGNNFTCYL